MNKVWIWILVVVIVGVFGWWFMQSGMDVMPGESENQMEETSLESVGDFSGSGIATRNYDGGNYAHTVTAQLADPSADKFYEGWIVRSLPFKFISTGQLNKSVDGSYVLEFSSNEDYSNYNKVVITQETKSLGLDNNPEAHVLEGSF
jgi:hypothetical protein